MTPDAIVVLSILGVSFALFVSDRVRPDLIAIGVLVALVVARVVEPLDAFAGFGSFAVITIAGLMVIGEGLVRTGVVLWVARRLERLIRHSTLKLVLVNTAIPGLLSGFVNIVAAAGFFVPVIQRLSKKGVCP